MTLRKAVDVAPSGLLATILTSVRSLDSQTRPKSTSVKGFAVFVAMYLPST